MVLGIKKICADSLRTGRVCVRQSCICLWGQREQGIRVQDHTMEMVVEGLGGGVPWEGEGGHIVEGMTLDSMCGN